MADSSSDDPGGPFDVAAAEPTPVATSTVVSAGHAAAESYAIGQAVTIRSGQETRVSDASIPPVADASLRFAGSVRASAVPISLQTENLKRGDTVGRYVVLERVGAGGMAVVYAAYDPQLDRRIALKLLRVDPTGSQSGDRGTLRLLREAQAMARLAHPNVVGVHDVGSVGNSVFLAMEFVEGATLEEHLRGARIEWREVLKLFVEAGRGLAAAHDAGLVHRDFKPSNVLVGRDGRVRVADFGLAREGRTSDIDSMAPTTRDPGMRGTGKVLSTDLTQGALLGTPAYMSPEQFAGKPTDARTDQFSFCVALYEALFAVRPFEGETLAALLAAVHGGEVRPPPKGSRVPSWLATAVLKGLQAKPNARHASMRELLAALTRDRRAGPRRLFAAVSVIVLGLGGTLAWARASQRDARACDAVASEMESVWNADTRSRVTSSFSAINQSYARDTSERVIAALDAYTRDWVAARVAACREDKRGSARGALTVESRNACLVQRLTQVQALAGAFSHADGATVQKAVEVVRALPAVDDCSDASRLAMGASLPADPSTRARLLDLRNEIVRNDVLVDTEQLKEGCARAVEVVDRARSVAFTAGLADALRSAGRCEMRAGQYPQARELLVDAVFTAEGARHDAASVDAQTDLVQLVGFHLGEAEAALLWARHARAIIDRNGSDPRLLAHLEQALGRVEYGRGRYGDALAHENAAIGWLERSGGPDQPEIAEVLMAMGNAHAQQRQLDAAVPYFTRAAAIWEKVVGARHPRTAMFVESTAWALGMSGRIDESLPLFDRALEIASTTVGMDHPDALVIRGDRAQICSLSGRLDEAIRVLTELLPAAERSFGKGGPGHIPFITLLGESWRRKGDPARAIAAHRSVLQEARARLGAEHLQVAITLYNMGRAHAMLGEFREAKRLQTETIAIGQKTLGKDGPMMAYAYMGMGEAQLGLGERDAAIGSLEHAERIFDSTKGDARELCWTRLMLATALAKAGRDPDRAWGLAIQARDGFAALRALGWDGLPAAERWLANRAVKPRAATGAIH